MILSDNFGKQSRWIQQKKFKSADEHACDEHFLETHRRNDSGRFVVQMLLKKNQAF